MDKPEEIAEKIREQRLIEATKKGYMGRTGKIHMVLFTLGQPIISQTEGGAYVDTHYLENDFFDPDETVENSRNQDELLQRIPIMYSEYEGGEGHPSMPVERPSGAGWADLPDPIQSSLNSVGYHFDALDRGVHLEIIYDDLDNVLKVHYKGYQVYKEIKGELVAYAPSDDWELHIEKLYKIARTKARKNKEEEFAKDVEKVEKDKKMWWTQLKERWGLK